jgi:outer membrane protein assembly factor BamB
MRLKNALGEFVIRSLEGLRQQRRLNTVRNIATCLFAVLLCLAAGCNNNNAAQNPVSLVTKPSFVKTWDVRLPLHAGDSITGIYLLDGVVHVVTSQNYDHAVKADGGQLLFLNQIGSADAGLKGGPTEVGDGYAFATTHTLEIFSRDGAFERSVDLGYNITSAPAGDQSFVFLGLDQGGGRFAEVDLTKTYNVINWEVMTFGTVDGAAALADHVVFFGSEDGALRSCLYDRTLYWPLLEDSKFTTGGKIYGDVLVDSKNCYFGSSDGTFYAIERETGKVRWQYFAGPPLEASPQQSDTSIYQYVSGKGLVALDKTRKLVITADESLNEDPGRSPRWVEPNATTFLAEDGQNTYVAEGRRGRLVALDNKTGQILFTSSKHNNLAFVTADPKTATIYGVTRDGVVMAVQPVLTPGSYGEVVSAGLH